MVQHPWLPLTRELARLAVTEGEINNNYPSVCGESHRHLPWQVEARVCYKTFLIIQNLILLCGMSETAIPYKRTIKGH